MPAATPPGATRCRFRTLFVSDVHLGCRYAQAERFLEFLQSVEVERLYIVGDFIDGWRLARRWYWQSVYIRIIQRLVQLAAQGTQVCYAPGNHDEFLRDYFHDFGLMTVADQFLHETADGRRFVVIHGDQFDSVERKAKWLSLIGANAYDYLVWANGVVNQVRRQFKMSDCRFSSRVKVWAKQAVQFVSDFEERLVCHAKELECDGVICGHIHVPRIDSFGEVTYCNTGDWVEHCTALVEHDSGELELIDCSTRHQNFLRRDSEWQRTTAEPHEFEPVSLQHAAVSALSGNALTGSSHIAGNSSLQPADLTGFLR